MFTSSNKKVIVSVVNDLASDQRVQRNGSVLTECGYEVLLVGRKLNKSVSVSHLPFKTKRMRMLFVSGPLFYFFFNVRLFFVLLFKNADLLFANDLDTLWPNYLASKLKNIPLVYDSHEIFCEVPELQNTPVKKRIWERLEKKIVPQLKYCITVNESIAKYFNEKYKVNFISVRNIPKTPETFKLKSKSDLKIPTHKKIIIFQGAGINIHRGAEELVQAMQFVDNTHLLIIGSGDVFPQLINSVSQLNLSSKITLINKLPKAELLHYTFNADLGISIDKDSNLNYRNSLPNKIFDYIQAQIPILASDLPEIKNIILKYDIGDFIENHEPKHMAQKINEMLASNEYSKWKNNTAKAIEENNWESEKKILANLINSITKS